MNKSWTGGNLTDENKHFLDTQEYRNAGLVQNKNIRVAKYLVPVIVASVVLNIPKFIETSVAYDEETGEVSASKVEWNLFTTEN